MKKCSICNKIYDDSYKWCIMCEKHSLIDNCKKVCKKCRQIYDADWNICPQCKLPLTVEDSRICPKCFKTYNAIHDHCKECDCRLYELTEENQKSTKVCPKCLQKYPKLAAECSKCKVALLEMDEKDGMANIVNTTAPLAIKTVKEKSVPIANSQIAVDGKDGKGETRKTTKGSTAFLIYLGIFLPLGVIFMLIENTISGRTYTPFAYLLAAVISMVVTKVITKR